MVVDFPDLYSRDSRCGGRRLAGDHFGIGGSISGFNLHSFLVAVVELFSFWAYSASCEENKIFISG